MLDLLLRKATQVAETEPKSRLFRPKTVLSIVSVLYVKLAPNMKYTQFADDVICTRFSLLDRSADYLYDMYRPVYTHLVFWGREPEMVIRRSSPEPLYLQIQLALREQIRAGKFPPGAQIPSEPALATQYQVSRMTARKAVNRLVAQGLLIRRPGKGTYVAQDVLPYGLSTMLSFSGTLCARGYTVETHVLRQKIIPAPPDVLDALNLQPGGEALIVRRLRLVDGSPMAIHTAYLDPSIFAPLLEVDLSVNSLLEAIEQICGAGTVYSKDSVRAVLANAQDCYLLGIPFGSPVLAVDGLAFDENGRPTRLSRAIYRGDRFKLAIKSTADQASVLVVENTGV